MCCHLIFFYQRWILTAAHCVSKRYDVKAHLGFDGIGIFKQKITIPPKHQHIHPKYVADEFFADIGRPPHTEQQTLCDKAKIAS